MSQQILMPNHEGLEAAKQILTRREKSIASFVARGLTNKEIAAEMAISVRTVENHVSHILEKTHSHNRVEIARYIFEGRI